MRNGEFNQQTVRALYKRAGEHCTVCKKITSKPHSDPEKFHNLGEAAHIHGLSDQHNLRFNPALSPTQLSHITNGVWLCLACHHEIDADETTYTADKLRQLKNDHESLIIRLHETGIGFLPAIAENEKRIATLEKLIEAKEGLFKANQSLFNQELTGLRFELEALRKENTFLKEQGAQIKRDVLDLNDPELNAALLQKDGIDKALDLLNADLLNQEEIRLAKARLLRARLLTAKGDLNEAQQEYERAFEFYPCANVAMPFIAFLFFFKMDFEKAIEVAAYTSQREVEPALKAELLANQAQATLKLERPEEARVLLEQAKRLVTEKYPDEVWAIAQTGKLAKHIGDCFKLELRYPEALKCYEQALNLFFIATAKGDNKLTVIDMAGLASAIGLLYEQNNLEEEAIIHHLRAFEVLKAVKDGESNVRAIICINLATCYLQRKIFDVEQALKFARLSHRILTKLSKTRPRDNMEYLIGAKCLLGDIFQTMDKAKSEMYYRESLKLADMLIGINPAFLKQKIHVLHNYAVFCVANQKSEQGLKLLDECISLLKEKPSTPLDRTVGLTKALLLKMNFAATKEERIAMLKEIVIVNEHTPRTEKTFAYKFMAEKMLAAMV